MVGSQIANLTPDPSFAHNLGCRCPNDQWKAIFDIYALRPFQWHQEHINARCFGPCCRTLNIWEWEFHPPTSPKVGLRHTRFNSLFPLHCAFTHFTSLYLANPVSTPFNLLYLASHLLLRFTALYCTCTPFNTLFPALVRFHSLHVAIPLFTPLYLGPTPFNSLYFALRPLLCLIVL